jgi:excisionase family DNA binding protein
MNKQILQIENISAENFKKEIISDFTNALKGFANPSQSLDSNILLNRQETADLLGISLVSLWEWTRKDIIPAYRIGNKVRYKKNEVLDSLKKMNQFKNQSIK